MSDLKRDEVKYIRDISKSAYKKDTECFICGVTDDLQFHHFYSITALWNKWKRNNKVIIKDVDDILTHREDFRDEHHNEIYNETVTLCKACHMNKLHKIYGKTPTLATALKQKRWCSKQKEKRLNK